MNVKKFRNIVPAIVIFTGGIISAIGALLAAENENKGNQELLLTNKKLAEAQSELLKFTTGADSYGQVEVIRIFDGKNGYYYNFYFRNLGKYPLYDVKVNGVDRNKLNKDQLRAQKYKVTLDVLRNYSLSDLGNIPPEGGMGLSYSFFKIKNNTVQDFLFIISTISNTYDQQLKFIQLDTSFYSATRVTIRQPPGQEQIVLIDTADINFPNAVNGKIDWQ